MQPYFEPDPFKVSLPEMVVIKRSNSEKSVRLEDSDEDEIIEFDGDQVEGFKSRLALFLLTLDPKHEEYYPDADPLESGLIFAVLLRKFSQLLENPRIDNLILTEIWLII